MSFIHNYLQRNLQAHKKSGPYSYEFEQTKSLDNVEKLRRGPNLLKAPLDLDFKLLFRTHDHFNYFNAEM